MPAIILCGCLHALLVFGPVNHSEIAVAYDQQQGQWLLDPAGVVSRNDVLLQSHGGVIRLLPAAPRNWSGVFRLRAEGGFLVAVDFAHGQPRLMEIHSERGQPCRIRNLWGAACVVRRDEDVVLRTNKPLVEFATQPGARYLLESADRPISTYDVRTIIDTPRQEPGLRGRGY